MIQVLYSETVIQHRIAELGAELTAYYRDDVPMVVVLLNGALFFAADLIRRIDRPVHLDSFAVSSYENNASTGALTARTTLKLNPAGRRVLLIDDILDTGLTLEKTKSFLLERGAHDVRTCVLLDKQTGTGKPVSADWVGFRCPDQYIVGYGLDSNEEFRNLPYIGVFSE